MSITARVPVHIRWMIRRDLQDVMGIEDDLFPSSISEEELLRFLRQRNCIAFVAELGERVVGYVLYELQKNHLQLLRLAVAPTHRRCHVGRQLIDKLKSKLNSHRRTAIKFAADERNLEMLRFLQSQQFLAAGVARDHFEDADAYLMEFTIAAALPEEPEEADCNPLT